VGDNRGLPIGNLDARDRRGLHVKKVDPVSDQIGRGLPD
jgi:hypothetical protein